MTAKRKKKPSPPKVRRTWRIRPATRVKPSAKIYRRPAERKKTPSWVDEVSWFGDEA
jgi:hypothetical protein